MMLERKDELKITFVFLPQGVVFVGWPALVCAGDVPFAVSWANIGSFYAMLNDILSDGYCWSMLVS